MRVHLNIVSQYLYTVLLLIQYCVAKDELEEKHGVKYASDCEVCKVVSMELQSRLEETGKTHDVIETGYSFDSSKRKKTVYKKSELRLVESLDGLCDRVLQYNIHKERKDSTRFARGMSETFRTLHGLVDKGVKVELGMPFELWDKPSAEITHLKTQCENLLERHEEAIEQWYFSDQMREQPLRTYLCEERALRDGDQSCLGEEEVMEGEKKDEVKHKKGETDDVDKNIGERGEKDEL